MPVHHITKNLNLLNEIHYNKTKLAEELEELTKRQARVEAELISDLIEFFPQAEDWKKEYVGIVGRSPILPTTNGRNIIIRLPDDTDPAKHDLRKQRFNYLRELLKEAGLKGGHYDYSSRSLSQEELHISRQLDSSQTDYGIGLNLENLRALHEAAERISKRVKPSQLPADHKPRTAADLVVAGKGNTTSFDLGKTGS